MIHQTIYNKDIDNKKLAVSREFSAPSSKVWKAWTEPAMLDQWWAPKPWKAETKTMNFKTGGFWLYAMVGPDATRHWSRADYISVTELKEFTGKDCFCDENGIRNPDFPSMLWEVKFHAKENSTLVTIDITFDSIEDLKKIVEMGFEEGFRMAHGNLDQLLAQ